MSRGHLILVLALAGCIDSKQVGHNPLPDQADAAPPGNPIDPTFTILTRGPEYAVAVTSDATAVYWVAHDSAAGRSSVRRIARSGGADQELWLVGKNIQQIAADDTYLYLPTYSGALATLGSGEIVRLPKSGGPPQTLTSGENAPTAIAVDRDYVYYTVQDSAGYQEIRRLAKAGGVPVTLVGGINVASSLASDGTHLYYSARNEGRVMRVGRDGGTPVELAGGWSSTSSLVLAGDRAYFIACGAGAYEPASVFWASSTSGGGVRIGEADGFDQGIAVAGDTVFVPSMNAGSVSALPITGGPAQVLVDGRPGPFAVSADPNGAHVFWVDHASGDVGRIDLAEP